MHLFFNILIFHAHGHWWEISGAITCLTVKCAKPVEAWEGKICKRSTFNAFFKEGNVLMALHTKAAWSEGSWDLRLYHAQQTVTLQPVWQHVYLKQQRTLVFAKAHFSCSHCSELWKAQFHRSVCWWMSETDTSFCSRNISEDFGPEISDAYDATLLKSLTTKQHVENIHLKGQWCSTPKLLLWKIKVILSNT